MKKNLSIFVGKLAIITGKLLKRGSSLPGVIALKVDKDIMSKFILPEKIIAVTGSSGKGSISSMLAKVYREQGYIVAHNSAGSNLTPGIATLLLENCSITGKIKADILIYEIDERYTSYVFKDIKPNIVIISNITRDQPPRQGNFDVVFNGIKKAITDDMHLVLNGDDPYLRKFTFDHKGKITYYGINKNKYSYNKSKFGNLNLNYCPKCNNKLNYNFYNFENNGDYYCSSCNFKRPTIDFLCSKINYDNNEIIVNEKYKIIIPSNILYCVYNILAVFTASSLFNLDNEKTINTISTISRSKKLFDTYHYNNRIVTVLNNKNENNSTFNQSLLYVTRYKELKTIVIGWKEISRRYNFDDLSWLYDIDFELLNKANIDKIVCIGIHKYDIAVRIKLAGIDENKIRVFDNLLEGTNYIKNKTKGNIYGILNFDYVKPFNEYMLGDDQK